VLSNKPDFATVSIVRKIFGELVDVVHGGREGIALKPAPDAILALLSELSCEANECAYIGDSEIDVKTGINAEIENSVAVTWGFRTEEQLGEAGAVKFAKSTDELEKFIFI
jgi:phosphoglycolate phosphatase